ncbi:TIGR02453 family protein [Nitriliruptoraceae bacterium ZYF776]|nr:TIGR02453 family protein [Profundirhabdus halotolerans]
MRQQAVPGRRSRRLTLLTPPVGPGATPGGSTLAATWRSRVTLRIGEFAGFPPEAFRFYAELEVEGNNDRAWFDANRSTYERAVRLPMEELLDRAAADGFGDDGKVFRPNRDVRFSKDKRPYKGHCGAVVNHDDGTATASIYAQVDATGLVAGRGYWHLSRDQLDRFRRAVDDDGIGGELVGLVAAARAAGHEVEGSELKRAPQGYPVDHPRIELLRHKRLAVLHRWPVADWMHTPAAYDHLAGLWRDAAPIAAWLERHVGAAAEPRRRRGG